MRNDVVSVPGGPSEVAGPVSGVVVPTATVIVEGTTASTSGNEGPLDLGVVQTPITGERGKAPLESIDEHRPIREAAKNVAISTEAITFFEKLLGAKDSMISGAPVDLLKELLGVTFSDAAKDVFQRRVSREEIKLSIPQLCSLTWRNILVFRPMAASIPGLLGGATYPVSMI
ncbi:hypothetical protein V6N11_080824 [Hibiscus sabdariffa]|uniref:Uncharacterized protein n=1 Tax=Hibiscus sabdariffa TaxID=183260 RepID=A0ABR2QIK7_9ROSI